MKIHGHDSLVAEGMFELLPATKDREAVMVKIRGLPHGFGDKMMKLFPLPVPPNKPAYGPEGKVRYKPGTKIILTEPDYDDPKFQAEQQKRGFHHAAWIIYYGTKDDPNMEWEADPNTMEPEEFCKKVDEELTRTGIGQGRVAALVDAINYLSGITETAMEEARKRFLSVESGE